MVLLQHCHYSLLEINFECGLAKAMGERASGEWGEITWWCQVQGEAVDPFTAGEDVRLFGLYSLTDPNNGNEALRP